jgi:hypothetical protein
VGINPVVTYDHQEIIVGDFEYQAVGIPEIHFFDITIVLREGKSDYTGARRAWTNHSQRNDAKSGQNVG